MKTLVIPPAAQRDEKAIQMLSAWIAERGQHCTINVGMWHDSGKDEPHAWGIFLADTVRHIANALQEKHGLSAPDTLESILESIHEELSHPTSAVSGGFSPGHS